ncbi:hypothetical protein C0J52_18478 [Blattella germanica]|nr:hypothetical protein C0J52_18478 [Blattella germanica]
MFLQTPELKKATNTSVTNNNATPTIAIDIESRCNAESNEICGNDTAEEVDLITRFCMPVCTRDLNARSKGLQVIEKTVMGWLDGYGSPKHSRLPTNATSIGNNVGVNNATTNGHCCQDKNNAEYVSLVTLHMPTILRLSVNCPFIDVRDSFTSILQHVQYSTRFWTRE